MKSQETPPEEAPRKGGAQDDVVRAGSPDKHLASPGFINNLAHSRWTRWAVLVALVAAIAAGIMVACGGGDPTPTPAPTPTVPAMSPLNTPTPVGGAVSPLDSPLPAPSDTPGQQGAGTEQGGGQLQIPGQPYVQYLPYVALEDEGGPGIAAIPLPTEPPPPTATPQATNTPKATKTPRPPTPTPTPPATPFPPGPPSKLGVFIGHNDPQFFELIKTKGVAVVKTLELDPNFLREIKQLSPNTKIIARMDYPQVNLATFDPIAEAQSFVNQVLQYADDPARKQYIDGWEALNEPIAANSDEMKKLAQFEAERTRLLGEKGIRSVIGNFGTGQPPMELWPDFLPAVEVAKQYDGWLGLHEYSAPTIYFNSTADGKGRYPGVTPQDSGWLTLRYRKVYDEVFKPAGLAIPLVLTELGVDGLVQNRPGPENGRGWTDFQDYWAQNGYGDWGPGSYVEQLAWYDEAMRQNDYVIGGTIYAISPTAGWETYDIRGPAANVLGQYFSVHAPQ